MNSQIIYRNVIHEPLGVLGSGVSGLCVAMLLAERGETVEVIDDEARQPASWFAGGMLAPWCG